jgi:hypothetical protein
MLQRALLNWRRDADPALRWQVERDLAGAPPEVCEATRVPDSEWMRTFSDHLNRHR